MNIVVVRGRNMSNLCHPVDNKPYEASRRAQARSHR
jgi:hypothetical protein